nr:DUF2061 domain-containing protein [uncultured Cohaesibacter sp.]
MDSKTRTIAKAASWQVLGLFSMTLVGYFFTHSVAASGGIAITSALTSFVFYCGHERAWSHIRWGQLSK